MIEKRREAASKELVRMTKAFEGGKSKTDLERTKLINHPKFKKLSNIIYDAR